VKTVLPDRRPSYLRQKGLVSVFSWNRGASCKAGLQCVVHLLEGWLGLFKETEDNRLTEFTLILVVIHLQDLFEGHGVDAVAEIWQADGAFLALLRGVSCCAWLRSYKRKCLLTLSSASWRVLSGIMTIYRSLERSGYSSTVSPFRFHD